MKAVMVLCSACKQYTLRVTWRAGQGAATAPLEHYPKSTLCHAKIKKSPAFFPLSWHHPRHFPSILPPSLAPNIPYGNPAAAEGIPKALGQFPAPGVPVPTLRDSSFRTPNEFVKPWLVWLPLSQLSSDCPQQLWVPLQGEAAPQGTRTATLS